MINWDKWIENICQRHESGKIDDANLNRLALIFDRFHRAKAALKLPLCECGEIPNVYHDWQSPALHFRTQYYRVGCSSNDCFWSSGTMNIASWYIIMSDDVVVNKFCPNGHLGMHSGDFLFECQTLGCQYNEPTGHRNWNKKN